MPRFSSISRLVCSISARFSSRGILNVEFAQKNKDLGAFVRRPRTIPNRCRRVEPVNTRSSLYCSSHVVIKCHVGKTADGPTSARNNLLDSWYNHRSGVYGNG